MLIGICGKKFSGKSTVAKMLSEMLGYKVVSFADKLKDVTCVLSGCTREQLEDYDFKESEFVPNHLKPYCGNAEFPTYRAFLQHFGSEVMRGINDDIWIDCTLDNCGENAIISDCRFPNEAKAIKEKGGVIIRIERKSCESNGDSHMSETELNTIVPDYLVDNNGSIKDLANSLNTMVQRWRFLNIV